MWAALWCFVSTLCEGSFRTEPRFLCHSRRLQYCCRRANDLRSEEGCGRRVRGGSVDPLPPYRPDFCVLFRELVVWVRVWMQVRGPPYQWVPATRLTPFAQPIECLRAHATARLPKAALHSPPSPQAKVRSSPMQMAAISPAQRTMTAARARSAMGMATPSPRLVGGATLTGSRVRCGVHRWTAGANWASEGSSTRYVYSFQRGHDVYGFTVSPKLVLKWLQCTNTAVPMSRDVAPNVSTHPASLLFVINVPHTAPCVFLRRYLGLLFLGHSLVPMGGWSWVLHSWLQYVCGAA